MGYSNNRDAARQDKVRRSQPYKALATGRRTKAPVELAAEQAAYRNRFPTPRDDTDATPTGARVYDINDNYPDIYINR
jgi:hypothetical protein